MSINEDAIAQFMRQIADSQPRTIDVGRLEGMLLKVAREAPGVEVFTERGIGLDQFHGDTDAERIGSVYRFGFTSACLAVGLFLQMDDIMEAGGTAEEALEQAIAKR